MKIKLVVAVIALVLITLIFTFRVFAQETRIKIIATSDLHGNLLPYDYLKRNHLKSSLASAATYIRQQKTNGSQKVVLLDNGDVLQGQPLVYYSNYYMADSLNVVSQMFNYLGYDAATMGNHDIETGHAVYDKIVAESSFPWLAANAINEKNGQPYFKPYAIVNYKKIKIAIIGLITPAIPNWLPPSIYAGMRFDDMAESAQKWIEIVRNTEHPDLVIGLLHSGMDYEYNGYHYDSYKNENASKIVALNVDGFDLVIAGHDHTPFCDSLINKAGRKVFIVNPGGLCENIAVAEISIRKTRKKSQIRFIKPALLAVKQYEPDPEFTSRFSDYDKKTKAYVDRKIGELTASMQSADALFGPCPMMNIIHKIQIETTGADISFTAPFSLNVKIDSGPLTISDMFSLYRFDNLLYTMELSGKEILQYLEFSYSLWLNTMKNADDPMLLFKKDSSGNITGKLVNPAYNLSAAYGIEYTVDITRDPGHRITISGMSNGEHFDIDRKYKVAINSYRAHGGGNHITSGCGLTQEEIIRRIVFSTEKDIRYYLIQWVEQHHHIVPPDETNWKIIPDAWVTNGKQNAMSLLFPKK